MNIKYIFLNKIDLKKTLNLGLFCDENFNILNLHKLEFLNQTLITKLVKNNKNGRTHKNLIAFIKLYIIILETSSFYS